MRPCIGERGQHHTLQLVIMTIGSIIMNIGSIIMTIGSIIKDWNS